MVSGSLIGQAEPIIVKAESDILGADYPIMTSADITYISSHTNPISTIYSGYSGKIASCNVNFSDSGTCKRFAGIRAGSTGQSLVDAGNGSLQNKLFLKF